MSVAHEPTTSDGDVASHYGHLTANCDGVEIQVQLRHLATVVTISGPHGEFGARSDAVFRSPHTHAPPSPTDIETAARPECDADVAREVGRFAMIPATRDGRARHNRPRASQITRLFQIWDCRCQHYGELAR
jgi:hypothetical protein